MSKWISFRNLINSLDIMKFEILEYLKGGLKPYSKDSGRPLDCPSFCHIGHLHEDSIKIGLEILSEANDRDLDVYEQLIIAQKESAEKELEDIKKDDPSYCSWKWLSLSDDEFERLFSYLDEAVFRRDDVLEFEKKFKQGPKEENSKVHYQKVFPCSSGTKWEDIHITLISDDTVEIKTPSGEGRFGYRDLGLEYGKANKPRRVWIYIVIFCKTNGVISAEYFSDLNRKNAAKHLVTYASKLNKHLQGLFGIKESIFQGHYRKEKGYKTRLRFVDATKVTDITPKNTQEEVEEIFQERQEKYQS